MKNETNPQTGFTLVEMVIAMGITGAILLGMGSFMAATSKNMMQDARAKARDSLMSSVRRYLLDNNSLRSSVGMSTDPSKNYANNLPLPDASLPPQLQSGNIAAQSPGNQLLQNCLSSSPTVWHNCIANEWISFDLYEPVFSLTAPATSWHRVGGMDHRLNPPVTTTTTYPQLYRMDGTPCAANLAAPTADCRFQVITEFSAQCRELDPNDSVPRANCDSFEDVDPSDGDPTRSYAVEAIRFRFTVREVSAATLAFSDSTAQSSVSTTDGKQRLVTVAGREETLVVRGCEVRGEVCHGMVRSSP